MLPEKYTFSIEQYDISEEPHLVCRIYGHKNYVSINKSIKNITSSMIFRGGLDQKDKIILFLKKYYNENYTNILIRKMFNIFMNNNLFEAEEKINLLIMES